MKPKRFLKASISGGTKRPPLMEKLLPYMDQLWIIQAIDLEMAAWKSELDNARNQMESFQKESVKREMECDTERTNAEILISFKMGDLEEKRSRIQDKRTTLLQYESQLKAEKKPSVIHLLRKSLSRMREENISLEKEYKALEEEISILQEQLQNRLNCNQELLKQYKTESRQKTDALKSEEVDLFLKLDALEESRGKKMALLPQEVVEEYEAMRLSADGIAIAEGSGGACSACHIQISSQILMKLETRRSLNLCENCGRILWIPKKQ